MSQVLQKPARRPWGVGLNLAAVFAGVALVIALALGPASGGMLRLAAAARLHAPDLEALAGLPQPIKAHLGAALAALTLGAALMAVRKGRLFHRAAGWVWVSLVAVTAGSSLFITSLRPGAWSLLHLLTAWTLLILPLAVVAARRHKVARHRRAMMGLFYGGFVINLVVALMPGRTLWTVFFG